MIFGVLQKVKNTGSSDPFNARLMFQIFELRDKMVKNDSERSEFDRLYTPVLESMEETQDSFLKCKELIINHKKNVEDGSIIKFQGEIIEVSESINRELKSNFKDFFVKGNRAITLLIPLFKKYGVSINFLFKNDKDFKKGLTDFSDKHKGSKYSEFVKMVLNDRESWLSKFNKGRQKVEPDIKYIKNTGGQVVCLIPKVDGLEILDLLDMLWGNLFDFIEDCVVFLINFNLEKPWEIVVVPEDKRDVSMPVKYKIWLEGLSAFLESEAKKKNEK